MLQDFHASATQDGPEDFEILANWKQGDAHPRSATWTCTGKDERDALLDRLRDQAVTPEVDTLEALERAVDRRASRADGKPR